MVISIEFCIVAYEDLVNTDKIWQHGVIRYLQKKELASKKIHVDMVATLEDDAPALSHCEEVDS